jgi:rhodanese-related sulfurtransferase
VQSRTDRGREHAAPRHVLAVFPRRAQNPVREHLRPIEIADTPYTNPKPAGAKSLLDSSEGWIYLDVRTPEEFQAGHAAGAYNVPYAMRDRTGRMTPNDEFTAVVQRNFAKDAKLVLACATGMRSVYACQILESAGYTSLVNMQCGFVGARDGTGEIVEPGWQACGYPCETSGPPERTYRKLWERK